MAAFFPSTSPADVRKSIWVTLATILLTLVPTALRVRGVFIGTSFGLIVFAYFLLYGLSVYRQFPYQTKDSLSQVITLPIKSIGLLLTVWLTCWLGLRVFHLHPIPSRLGMGLSSSAIEFVAIYCSALYVSLLVNYLLKHRNRRE